MSRGRRGAVALLLAAGCGGGPARDEVPEGVFAAPPDTILTRYVQAPGAAWLGGSRWAVVAPEFNEAAVVDFARGGVRPLGGPGDGALRNPFAVFAFGDTAYVADWATRRVTAWTADGRFVGSWRAPDPLRGALPRARDAAGRWYIEVPPPPGRDGSGNRDSAVVVRASRDLARLDTVVRLSPLDLAELDDPGGRRFERRVFSGTDKWGVRPDGAIWVARVYQNRVYWITPDGNRTRGQALPDRIIEVTAIDREHWLLQFPEELRTTAERLPFSPLKPPFENGFTAPGGEVWLEKSRPVVDSVRSYHVVDRAGRLRALMVLPIRQGRVVMVGDSVALAAEQYADGVRLMQVPIPRPAVPERP